jgi:UDP:flavonoid glycosyltransferase YjiC (YdhE family)
MGADQQLNAARVDALGLGVSLRADTADVAQVRDALAEVLASTPMQQRLEAMRDEISACPARPRRSAPWRRSSRRRLLQNEA